MNVSRSGPMIMFSNSSGMLKPPATEKQLECTLEELYHGCVKHIKVSRDVFSITGQIVQEDEVLTVNIKPGWKTGTRITFQGIIKEERQGEYPGDIIFVVTEKHHPLFRRMDDDLELEIEIPMVDALTGCNLYIPLLGKDKMSMRIDEIIYPGYEKTFVGQGMPNQKNPHHKGNLKVKFLVAYPNSLTDEQRSEIFRILSN
uniref:Chaperone DnaJ C-terminal domain-containing protein n=2 Tax=Chenopodium quinoa TaxID=63459 RepID=A0A803LV13_CHEQI